jgi:hypothetical protein
MTNEALIKLIKEACHPDGSPMGVEVSGPITMVAPGHIKIPIRGLSKRNRSDWEMLNWYLLEKLPVFLNFELVHCMKKNQYV